MRRGWIAGLALVTAACGTATRTVQCGGCPGSSFLAKGLPAPHGTISITACVDFSACQRTRVSGATALQGLQYVALPTGARWSEYDGAPVQVSMRTENGSWQGAGTFEYTPPDGSPCDCGSLIAPISMHPASPRG